MENWWAGKYHGFKRFISYKQLWFAPKFQVIHEKFSPWKFALLIVWYSKDIASLSNKVQATPTWDTPLGPLCVPPYSTPISSSCTLRGLNEEARLGGGHEERRLHDPSNSCRTHASLRGQGPPTWPPLMRERHYNTIMTEPVYCIVLHNIVPL